MRLHLCTTGWPGVLNQQKKLNPEFSYPREKCSLILNNDNCWSNTIEASDADSKPSNPLSIQNRPNDSSNAVFRRRYQAILGDQRVISVSFTQTKFWTQEKNDASIWFCIDEWPVLVDLSFLIKRSWLYV